jgi:hypothetical protein
LVDHTRDEIKKPLIRLARVQPERGLDVKTVSLEPFDQPWHVLDLVFYQRCLIYGSTPCAVSVIAAIILWACA